MVNVNKISNMLSTSEAAELLHVHPNTLRRWADKGLINSYRITKRGDRRFLVYDIEHFLLNSQIDQRCFAPPVGIQESTAVYSRKITDSQLQIFVNK